MVSEFASSALSCSAVAILAPGTNFGNLSGEIVAVSALGNPASLKTTTGEAFCPKAGSAIAKAVIAHAANSRNFFMDVTYGTGVVLPGKTYTIFLSRRRKHRTIVFVVRFSQLWHSLPRATWACFTSRPKG